MAANNKPFGDMVPYGDPSWYQDWFSPYYNDSHRKFRAAMREFVEKEIMPYCNEWDEQKKVPRELYRKVCQLASAAASSALQLIGVGLKLTR
jgi:alkylation response protein AidB-like acyl-CoA dehydrogenase